VSGGQSVWHALRGYSEHQDTHATGRLSAVSRQPGDSMLMHTPGAPRRRKAAPTEPRFGDCSKARALTAYAVSPPQSPH
jgi:hypothetical protein